MTERHPPEAILRLSTAYWASRCLHVIAQFGIADALGDEPQSAAALAAKTGTNADALHRILRAVCNYGIFTLRDGVFAHNAASRLLRSDNPASMRSLAQFMGLDFHWDVYRHLGHSLKTGESAALQVVRGGSFEYLRDHPDDGRIFNEAMVGKSFGQIAPVLGAYDFSGFKTIGDIGGGVGHLLAAILNAAPTAKGVLFDLPEVIAQAKARPNPRITYVGGDFFKDKVPACDLYVMMTVIHDWSDAESISIFRNLRGNAPSHAKLLLVEAIVDESATDSFPIDMDIEMLAFVHGPSAPRLSGKACSRSLASSSREPRRSAGCLGSSRQSPPSLRTRSRTCRGPRPPGLRRCAARSSARPRTASRNGSAPRRRPR